MFLYLNALICNFFMSILKTSLYSALKEVRCLQIGCLPVMYGFLFTPILICLRQEAHLRHTAGVTGKAPNPLPHFCKIVRWHRSIVSNREPYCLYCICDMFCLISKMHCFYVSFLFAFFVYHWGSYFPGPLPWLLTCPALLYSLGVEDTEKMTDRKMSIASF